MLATLFGLVVLVSIILFCVGMIKPRWAIWWGNAETKDRKKVLKSYVVLFMLSFIGVVFTVEPTISSSKNSNSNKVKEVVESKIEEESKKLEEKEITLKENPYKQYKDYPVRSPEYLFYYLNEYYPELDKYREKRDELEKVLAESSQKKYVKFNDSKEIIGIRGTNSSIYYVGEMKNNRPHGMGALYKKDVALGQYVDILLFKGEFTNGKFDGYGQYYGFFENNEAQSQGYDYKKEYNVDTQTAVYRTMNYVVFEGNYKNGVVIGEGLKYQYFSASEIESISEVYKLPNRDITIWSGNFNNNGAVGDFKIYISRNLAYEGKMDDSKLNGYGTIYYPNKKIRYKGYFKDDKFDGEGTLYNEDGSIEYEGKWKMGEYT